MEKVDLRINVYIYIESIVFDKMSQRKLINFIFDMMTLLFIFVRSVFFGGLETVKLGKVY